MPIEDMVEEKNELTDEILKPLIMQAIELGIRNMGVSEEHGGEEGGYSRMLPRERMYRDVRLYRIAEGPDEMMKHVIARHMLQME